MPFEISLDDKYSLKARRAYMTGVEALVLLPILQHQRDLEQGLNTAAYISGYRGSPVGTVDQAMWQAKPFLDQHNIVFQAGVNEDLAATAVWGSQQVGLFEGGKYDGVFGLWYGKGPGLDRSMDVIKHANASGTSPLGGVLAVAGDDHASKSSSLPHQSEHMFIAASIPVLNPANVQEVLDYGLYGWALSRFSGAWVGLKAITDNMDSAISAIVDPGRVTITLPEDFAMPADGVHVRWPDQPLAQEQRLNKFKIYAAREFARVNGLNRIVLNSEQPRLGIMTTGKAYLDVMQALEDLGIDKAKACAIGLRIFKVGMSWPLEPVATHDFAEGLEEILVVEEKRSILEDQLTSQLYNWPVSRRPKVVGEFDEQGLDLLPNLSELTPAMVARVIAARLGRFYRDDAIDKRLAFYQQKEQRLAKPRQQLQRLPHYCSGCPHSTSTRTPEGSRTLGGIGCHYMGLWETGDRKVETFTQMGGEGVSWVGQAPFTRTGHVFQNLGDGTYFHSGLLAIRQTVAAGVNITYKILYNDAVAMTGGQPVDGPLSIAQMILQLRGEGVKRIALVSDDPQQYRGQLDSFTGFSLHPREQLIALEKELRQCPGTSVLIYQQTCAAEKRRRRKKGVLADPPRRVVINPEVCEGCGDCSVQSNCLSVLPLATELGRKRVIDQNACNKDFSCLKGFCPSFVTVEGGRLKKTALADQAADFAELPPPLQAGIEHRPWNIVITGIGGTGVLTIASLIAMAAHIEGKGCATMNQTGMAQKFGAVVSHVRVGQTQQAIHSVRVPAGDADLLLGCDLVVSASDEALAKVNIERSHAIINAHQAMTAEFVGDPDLRFTDPEMRQSIIEEVGQGNVAFINATELATQLFGDTIASNCFLLGYACQQGLLPVSIEALEQAITLNAVAVDLNKKALLWGRRAAVDSDKVMACAQIAPAFKPLQKVRQIIADRYQRLIDYQNESYARRYLELVSRIQQAEARVMGATREDLSRAVARFLFKLMACKDEYEVARLYSNGDFQHWLAQHFEGDYRLQFYLAPPGLANKDPDTGLPLKRRFPQLLLLGFKWLAKCKVLRGSWLDPFSYSKDRQLEQNLLADYEELLLEIDQRLAVTNYEVAVALAELPEQIRGYGHIKERHSNRVAVRRSTLLKQLRGDMIEVHTEMA